MGAGKTTVGRIMSDRLGLSFIDMDYYIEGRFHKTVEKLFSEKGENAFRDIERRMLHEVAMFEDVLVSTGGGVPCFYDNMTFMNEVGTTVYLKVSVNELTNRLEACKSIRPVLQGRHGEALKTFITDNLKKRESFYSKAELTFNAEIMMTELDVLKISEALIEILESKEAKEKYRINSSAERYGNEE